MIHAREKDFEEVKKIFQQHKEWFGFVRMDYVQRMIMNNGVKFNFPVSFDNKHVSYNLLIFEENVVITYTIIRRSHRMGNVKTFKGDYIIHQIGAKNRDGSASRILQKIFQEYGTTSLTVRSDNVIAKKFYLKNNMKLVGECTFSKGTIPGDVYSYVDDTPKIGALGI